jgi:hypothetical protein
MTSPFVPLSSTRQKFAKDFERFLGKVFENIKCARPQKAGKRKCIVNGIYMIRQFIFMGRFFPGGGRAFFNMSMTGLCQYALYFMAATSFLAAVLVVLCHFFKG